MMVMQVNSIWIAEARASFSIAARLSLRLVIETTAQAVRAATPPPITADSAPCSRTPHQP
jgi:hypothetical protein